MSTELIRTMLDSIESDDNAAAQETFHDLIGMKLTDALDQRKQDIARQLGAYNADVQAD